MAVESKLVENIEQLRKSIERISVYNISTYSMLELYYAIARKLNEVINEMLRFEITVSEEVIEQNKKLIYLLGEGLKIEVVKKIDEMVADGTFDTIINHDIFNNLNKRIDDLSDEVDKKIDDIITIRPSGKDDTVIIQEAIDKFKKVILAEGTYNVGKLFIKNGTSIKGRGYSRTTLLANIDDNVIAKKSIDVDVANITIEGLKIQNKFDTTKYVIDLGSTTSEFTGARYSVFRDILIDGNYGVKLNRIWCTRFNNVRFNCKYKAIHLKDGCNNVPFRDCVINGANASDLADKNVNDLIFLEGSPTEHTNITFDNCTFEKNKVKSIFGYNIKGFSVKNCYFESSDLPTSLLRIENCPSAEITGNYINCPSSMSRFAELYASSSDLLLSAGKVKFSNNVFSNSKPTMSIFYDVSSKENTLCEQTNTSANMKYGCYFANIGQAPRQPIEEEIIKTGVVDFRYSSSPVIATPSVKIPQGWFISKVSIIITESYTGATAQTCNVNLIDNKGAIVGRIDVGLSSIPTKADSGDEITIGLKTNAPTFRNGINKDEYSIKIFGGNGGDVAIKGYAKVVLQRFMSI